MNDVYKFQIYSTNSRPRPSLEVKKESPPFSESNILKILKKHLPEDFILTEECPSIMSYLQDIIPIDKPDTFYTMSSGGLGWTMPASIGLSIGEKLMNRNRPVICLIGDGSFQYSIQSLFTGVNHKAHVIYLVFQNHEYGILKEFAVLEKTPNVPGLNLPGLDIVSLAKGYGAYSRLINSHDEFIKEFKNALDVKRISVIVIPTKKVSTGLMV
jgi:benzoylformate decarboxylase